MAKRYGHKSRLKRMKKALNERRERGLRISGKAPYGYSIGADGASLVVNEAEQDVMMEIWWGRQTGDSYRGIAWTLSQQGFRPRSGNTWQASTIRSIYERLEQSDVLSGEAWAAASKRREARRAARTPDTVKKFILALPKTPEEEEEFRLDYKAYRKEYLNQFRRP